MLTKEEFVDYLRQKYVLTRCEFVNTYTGFYNITLPYNDLEIQISTGCDGEFSKHDEHVIYSENDFEWWEFNSIEEFEYLLPLAYEKNEEILKLWEEQARHSDLAEYHEKKAEDLEDKLNNYDWTIPPFVPQKQDDESKCSDTNRIRLSEFDVIEKLIEWSDSSKVIEDELIFEKKTRCRSASITICKYEAILIESDSRGLCTRRGFVEKNNDWDLAVVLWMESYK